MDASGSKGSWVYVCKICKHRIEWHGDMLPKPPCPKCEKRKHVATPQKPSAIDDDTTTALAQCDYIIGMCDEVPVEGEDFADSIREKVESISEWIERHNEVTDNQRSALDNMESGVERWVH